MVVPYEIIYDFAQKLVTSSHDGHRCRAQRVSDEHGKDAHPDAKHARTTQSQHRSVGKL